MKKGLLVLVCVVMSATQNMCMDRTWKELERSLADKQWKKLDQCAIDKQQLWNLRSSATKSIFVLNCVEMFAEELVKEEKRIQQEKREKRQYENIQRTCARYRLTKSNRNSLKFMWK